MAAPACRKVADRIGGRVDSVRLAAIQWKGSNIAAPPLATLTRMVLESSDQAAELCQTPVGAPRTRATIFSSPLVKSRTNTLFVPAGVLLVRRLDRTTPLPLVVTVPAVWAALELFREEGFDSATMLDIAEKARVATGAAYYYYPSKEAIVMDFYQRACAEMQPKIEAALEQASGLVARLRGLIQVKLTHFAPNRGVLRALLRNGADPKHPLSPFS